MTRLALNLSGYINGVAERHQETAARMFPGYHHARIVSGFLIGLPIAVALGAPVSTALLGLDGLFGLRGWQIMFIAEGLPTVLVGVATLFVLTDRPEQARFLSEAEKT